MLTTLLTHTVTHGMLAETWEVQLETSDNSIFVQNILDAEEGGPIDTLHVDRGALWPVIRGLTRAAAILGIPNDAAVIDFVDVAPHLYDPRPVHLTLTDAPVRVGGALAGSDWP